MPDLVAPITKLLSEMSANERNKKFPLKAELDLESRVEEPLMVDFVISIHGKGAIAPLMLRKRPELLGLALNVIAMAAASASLTHCLGLDRGGQWQKMQKLICCPLTSLSIQMLAVKTVDTKMVDANMVVIRTLSEAKE